MSGVQYIGRGEAIDYTPTSAVTAGDVVVLGDLVGVAKRDIAANELGSLHVAGMLDFPKATGASTGITAGTNVYWDDAGDIATADDASGANKLIGKCVLAASDADTVVRVRMNQ